MSEKFEDLLQNEDDLVAFEEEDVDVTNEDNNDVENKENGGPKHSGTHTTGFRDLLLKPEILRSVQECGFEHPSEVQQECIPQAIMGIDVICQAKSGMGKTAVFVLSTLQQIEPQVGVVDSLVLCHTRELAYQICKEFNRFVKYIPGVKVAVFYGGVPVREHRRLLKEETPNIVVGTPGRLLQLVKEGSLKLEGLKRFILDECDSLLEPNDMRRDVQQIFMKTPREKQVMLFSATISKEVREIARKFSNDAMEVFVDSESKLTLHGLVQHFVKLTEAEKNRKLNDLLDNLDFNQVVIFVNNVRRAQELNDLLVECAFPSICIHSRMGQIERIEKYNAFKQCKSRILVSTNIFGRGVDIERVNMVINYDMPKTTDDYLHRVGRAGRFGTKGLSISFISTDENTEVLEKVQERFAVKITPLPATVNPSTYTQA